jgi:transcriptional accessory protein Tex/SPT6
MQLEGVVTNVAAFGAFVDEGVHQDGLVHISEGRAHWRFLPVVDISIEMRHMSH